MPEKKSPALSLSNVCVSYGSRQVLNGISLDLLPGQTFGLLGLNGVGKTTLIKTILGLRDPAQGDVKIGGLDRTLMEAKKQIAYLPERFDPPGFLTGLEFLSFSVRLYGGTFTRAQAESAAAGLALDPAVLKNRVQTYSKGMRQKLGLLATFMTQSPLLILDEPMSGLDPQARMRVKEALQATKAGGRSVFITSHILSDMSEICDHVGVLSRGRLLYAGTPAGLLEAGGDRNIEKAFLSLIGPELAAA